MSISEREKELEKSIQACLAYNEIIIDGNKEKFIIKLTEMKHPYEFLKYKALKLAKAQLYAKKINRNLIACGIKPELICFLNVHCGIKTIGDVIETPPESFSYE